MPFARCGQLSAVDRGPLILSRGGGNPPTGPMAVNTIVFKCKSASTIWREVNCHHAQGCNISSELSAAMKRLSPLFMGVERPILPWLAVALVIVPAMKFQRTLDALRNHLPFHRNFILGIVCATWTFGRSMFACYLGHSSKAHAMLPVHV